nr:MAG TPA: hypothetical protein [Caudoviricetes sp.]
MSSAAKENTEHCRIKHKITIYCQFSRPTSIIIFLTVYILELTNKKLERCNTAK